MNFEIYVAQGSPDSKEEALQITYDILYENGCVKEDFREACLEREKTFPTGLPTPTPIAIPHSDAVYSLKNAMCLLKLGKPVTFHNIESVEDTIDVDYVLNFSIVQQSNQIKTLVAIIDIFQDQEFLSCIREADEQQIKEELSRRLDAYEFDEEDTSETK